MKRLNVRAEMVDGTVLETQTAMKDYVLYETTAKRQKPPWGSIGENPSLWEAFVSWAALRRNGLYASGFETFQNETDIVDATPAADTDPTSAAAGDDSSST
jgi:hypothetical protein